MTHSDRKHEDIEAAREKREKEEEDRLEAQAKYHKDLEESMGNIRAWSKQLEDLIKDKKENTEVAQTLAQNIEREYKRWDKNMPEFPEKEKHHEAAAAGIMRRARMVLESFSRLFKAPQPEVTEVKVEVVTPPQPEIKVEMVRPPASVTGVLTRGRIVEPSFDFGKEEKTAEPIIQHAEVVNPPKVSSQVSTRIEPIVSESKFDREEKKSNTEKDDAELARYLQAVENISAGRGTRADSKVINAWEDKLDNMSATQKKEFVDSHKENVTKIEEGQRSVFEEKENQRRGPGRR